MKTAIVVRDLDIDFIKKHKNDLKLLRGAMLDQGGIDSIHGVSEAITVFEEIISQANVGKTRNALTLNHDIIALEGLLGRLYKEDFSTKKEDRALDSVLKFLTERTE